MNELERLNRRMQKVIRLRGYAAAEKHYHKVSQADYLLKQLSVLIGETLFFNRIFNNKNLEHDR